ncbi:MAG: UvrD-helicase domain-containing protein, partial [Planctomycetes bacterium]|nr:UvrD-helicase domain-containing protein [Planctomycetota bacterium]
MDLLANLNPQQTEAVTTIDGPLLVLAGPGSGKTRVITTRIAYMLTQGIPAWKILSMTFTNKAAAEMRRRVERFASVDELQISTFHSFGAWLMRRESLALGFQRNFSIYDTDDRDSLVRRIMKELKIDTAFVTASAAGYAISDAKNRAIDPETYRAGAYDVQSKAVADIYSRYEKALVEAQAMDFDDLLVKPLKLFTEHPDVLAKYRGRFSHIMIDEYQDTNTIQYRVSRLLAQESKNICVTGDPDQSIYSWRGA